MNSGTEAHWAYSGDVRILNIIIVYLFETHKAPYTYIRRK